MTCAPTGLRTAGRLPRPSRLPAIFAAVTAGLAKAFTIWSNRRAVMRLAGLEDGYLRDIGVCRSDVTWALAQPWYVDPSEALAARVERRRAAQRWARGCLTDSRRYAWAR